MSIRLLQEVLVRRCSVALPDARAALAAFEAIRLLRQPAAHLGGEKTFSKGMEVLGLAPERTDLWVAYHEGAGAILSKLDRVVGFLTS